MADENKTEMVEKPEPTEMEGKNQDAGKSEIDPTAELESIRAALKKANAEAAKYRKQAEQFEADKKAKEEAEMTALEKVQREAAELKAALKARELSDKKRTIAERVGLPPALASRLQGEADEEIEQDAKALLESLPKPQSPNPKAPQINPTNPSNPAQGETVEQMRVRLRGAQSDPFDPNFMKQHGGGVFFTEKE